MLCRVARLTQVPCMRFYAERAYESADRMRKHMGKVYSKQMTDHGGIATCEDVHAAFKAADKMMDLADEIKAAMDKKWAKALAKHARSEADALVSPRAGKKKKTGSPRSAIKLSDGGPSGRAHDVDGPGHGRAAVAAGVLLPAHVSPVAKVCNKIEWTVRTRVQLRRRP